MKKSASGTGYLGYFVRVAAIASFTFLVAGGLHAQDSDQITSAKLQNSHVKFTHVGPPTSKNGMAHSRFGITNVDSVASFNGQYFTPGQDGSGNPQKHWYTNTLGNPPEKGGTTTFNAPIVPVSLDLRNFDGSPRYFIVINGQAFTCPNPPLPGCQRLYFDVTPFLEPLLESPVFSDANYTSSPVPTQFTDAVQRAEFAKSAKPDWHTLLAPSVKTPRSISLVRGTYQFALNFDGSCCFFVLIDAGTFVNALFPGPTNTFPPDTSTPVGAAEAAGEMTTKDISTLFFPPSLLFSGANCCVGGFHAFDVEPGDTNNGNVPRLFIVNYSSWLNPIFVDPNIGDVFATSHELSETFNDPFVVFDGTHNLTPWWLAPNGECGDALETGDVIEGLPDEAYPITMPNGFTYHPQNEALLQWFEFQEHSDALGGAYSYPDPLVLPHLSPPQNAGCAP